MIKRGQILGLVILTGVLLLGVSQGAYADLLPITTLYNTGVQSAGVVLATNSTDGHYTVALASAEPYPVGGAAPYAWRYADGGWPVAPDGPWLGDSSTSTWIAPYQATAGGGDTDPNDGAIYVYRTTFDLSGYTGPATIHGRWSTDNNGAEIHLNGQNVTNLVGTIYTTPTEAFRSWYEFDINSGFVDGWNTLEFVVNNLANGGSGNPTGLRVEMTGQADWGNNAPATGVVPEPASLLVLGMGLVGLVTTRMRRTLA